MQDMKRDHHRFSKTLGGIILFSILLGMGSCKQQQEQDNKVLQHPAMPCLHGGFIYFYALVSFYQYQ